jgi:hypothetical protein
MRVFLRKEIRKGLEKKCKHDLKKMQKHPDTLPEARGRPRAYFSPHKIEKFAEKKQNTPNTQHKCIKNSIQTQQS